jgi:hypothetical protein
MNLCSSPVRSIQIHMFWVCMHMYLYLYAHVFVQIHMFWHILHTMNIGPKGLKSLYVVVSPIFCLAVTFGSECWNAVEQSDLGACARARLYVSPPPQGFCVCTSARFLCVHLHTYTVGLVIALYYIYIYIYIFIHTVGLVIAPYGIL